MNYIITTTDGEYLEHHGIKGMKWGIRRYQNEDGSLTREGLARYQSEYTSYKTKDLSNHPDSKAYQKSKEYDAKIAKQYDRESAGKAFMKNLLMAPTVHMTYNMARAADKSRANALLRAVFDIDAGMFIATGTGIAAQKLTGSSKTGLAVGLATRALSEYAQAKLRDTGEELSLQQRHLRNKYTQ